jgi:hypothetical protein
MPPNTRDATTRVPRTPTTPRSLPAFSSTGNAYRPSYRPAQVHRDPDFPRNHGRPDPEEKTDAKAVNVSVTGNEQTGIDTALFITEARALVSSNIELADEVRHIVSLLRESDQMKKEAKVKKEYALEPKSKLEDSKSSGLKNRNPVADDSASDSDVKPHAKKMRCANKIRRPNKLILGKNESESEWQTTLDPRNKKGAWKNKLVEMDDDDSMEVDTKPAAAVKKAAPTKEPAQLGYGFVAKKPTIRMANHLPTSKKSKTTGNPETNKTVKAVQQDRSVRKPRSSNKSKYPGLELKVQGKKYSHL